MISVPGELIFRGGGEVGVLVPGILIGEGGRVGRACCLGQQFSTRPVQLPNRFQAATR